ncbi:mRNA-degrading endonuclease RelE of RelBE toxin-antitoxin system [Filimonas zeae]|uniref:mRNA-degrading endonuclease RelE, toxin component of the RelBE toxin-antitoxin system n=1 Tax=Filimonas zeae TaxID=1737353 RepID=A0A917J499_9BACT|nr:type II toxin-antitoxin system RelE/ParE family toxin [Filimonas zeae]MDR6342636.1 mRNA-degrading endonuclease RelE of RelBE toxin-antitoxin system [Filimonas zeae]GGH82105.1 hypothetical protein GCM10011379_55490 [Filimonas zeae]
MNYSVETIPSFDKQLKKLVKKYPSLKQEFSALLDELEENPLSIKSIDPLGHDCYKVRLAIASKNTGKSGGARIVYFVQVINERVVLLSIFDKADQATVKPKQLLDLLKALTK